VSREVTELGPPILTESGETELRSYTSSVSLSEFPIQSNQWAAQYFKPALPTNAYCWKVTRVKFQALSTDSPFDEVTDVQLRPPAGGNLPSDTVLESVPLQEGDLTGSFAWQELSFSNVSDLSPAEGLCLVIKTSAPGPSCRVQHQSGGAAVLDAQFMEYSASWMASADKALPFYVYGTVTTVTRDPVTSTKLLAVDVTVNAGDNPQSLARASAVTLNRPVMP